MAAPRGYPFDGSDDDDAATLVTVRDWARPGDTGDPAAMWVDGPGDTAGDVAGEVMTGDPDRVAGSDSLLEVAGRMRSLLVALLPVCDPDGNLQGSISLRDDSADLMGRSAPDSPG